eukprot:TRINITY_DN3460_c0_g1_i2.p3 TRINITY_DN3460_c0_g1~~TRINITY_DN3460_c0_g1_i2.p3  ORF type:complete len:129 (+),score=17.93 TRINITY_DN3460_c0_g1_i2:580-966(+)
MYLHYMWIFLIMLFMIVTYAALIIYIKRSISRSASNSQKSKSAAIIRQLSGFPILFLIEFLPLGVARVLTYFNVPIPLGYLYTSICLSVSNGFFNAFLYGYTRKLHTNYLFFKTNYHSEDQTPLINQV